MTDDEAALLLRMAGSDASHGMVYELKLTDGDGTELVMFSGATVPVTITLPETTVSDNVQVYRMNDEGKAELIESTVNGNKVNFSVSHLEPCVVTWGSGSGTDTVLLIVGLAALASISLLLCLLMLRRRKADDDEDEDEEE